MHALDVLNFLPSLHLHTIYHYLNSLVISGHIRKVCLASEKKNVNAYEFQSENGIKTDIVSQALAHPLNQLTVSIFNQNK